jgi:hypothetical protein
MVTVDSREEELCLQRIDALSSYFRASRVRKEVQAEIEEEKELSLEGRKRFGLTQSSDDWMTMQKLDRYASRHPSPPRAHRTSPLRQQLTSSNIWQGRIEAIVERLVGQDQAIGHHQLCRSAANTLRYQTHPCIISRNIYMYIYIDVYI